MVKLKINIRFKIIKIIFIALAILLIKSNIVSAASVKAELIGKTEIEANTLETMELKISDSSEKVGSIGGKISARNITIEKIQGINGFKWLDFNKENGKFTAINPNEDVNGKSVIIITYRLDNQKTNGTIQISNVVAANSIDYKEVKANDISKKVKIAGTPDEPELKKGDINRDDRVTLYDAFTILRKVIMMTSEDELSEEEKHIMDFNNDEKATLYDAFSILRQVIMN